MSAAPAAGDGKRIERKPRASTNAARWPRCARMMKITSSPRSLRASASVRQRMICPLPMANDASARITHRRLARASGCASLLIEREHIAGPLVFHLRKDPSESRTPRSSDGIGAQDGGAPALLIALRVGDRVEGRDKRTLTARCAEELLKRLVKMSGEMAKPRHEVGVGVEADPERIARAEHS